MLKSGVREHVRKHLSDLADGIACAARKVPGVCGLQGLGLPPVNVYDTPDAVVVRAEVPGVARENLEVRLAGGRLNIHCRPDAGQYETYTCVLRERTIEEYSRGIALPAGVDEEAEALAVLADGVLTVRVRKQPLHEGKSINVEVR
jgi:HSP20 family protein